MSSSVLSEQHVHSWAAICGYSSELKVILNTQQQGQAIFILCFVDIVRM